MQTLPPAAPSALQSPAYRWYRARVWLHQHTGAVRAALGGAGLLLLAAAVVGAVVDRLFLLPVGLAAAVVFVAIVYADSQARRRVDAIGVLLFFVFTAAGGATCAASGTGVATTPALPDVLRALPWYQRIWPNLVVSAGSAVLCTLTVALLWAAWYAPWRLRVEGVSDPTANP